MKTRRQIRRKGGASIRNSRLRRRRTRRGTARRNTTWAKKRSGATHLLGGAYTDAFKDDLIRGSDWGVTAAVDFAKRKLKSDLPNWKRLLEALCPPLFFMKNSGPRGGAKSNDYYTVMCKDLYDTLEMEGVYRNMRDDVLSNIPSGGRLLYFNFKSHNILNKEKAKKMFDIIEKVGADVVCLSEALVPNRIAEKVRDAMEYNAMTADLSAMTADLSKLLEMSPTDGAALTGNALRAQKKVDAQNARIHEWSIAHAGFQSEPNEPNLVELMDTPSHIVQPVDYNICPGFITRKSTPEKKTMGGVEYMVCKTCKTERALAECTETEKIFTKAQHYATGYNTCIKNIACDTKTYNKVHAVQAATTAAYFAKQYADYVDTIPADSPARCTRCQELMAYCSTDFAWEQELMKTGMDYKWLIFAPPKTCPWGGNWGNVMIMKDKPTNVQVNLELADNAAYKKQPIGEFGVVESRSIIGALIPKHGAVFTTHLEVHEEKCAKPDVLLRDEQARAAVQFMDSFCENNNETRKTLVGDINSLHLGSYTLPEIQTMYDAWYPPLHSKDSTTTQTTLLADGKEGQPHQKDDGTSKLPVGACNILTSGFGAPPINKGQKYESLYQKCVSHGWSTHFNQAFPLFSDVTDFDHQPLVLQAVTSNPFSTENYTPTVSQAELSELKKLTGSSRRSRRRVRAP